MCLGQVTLAQESRSVEKRKAQLEKQEDEKKRLGEKAHEEGIEKHMQIQTKETRKRMKQNKKKAKRVNNNRGKSFFQRLFSQGQTEAKIFFAET
jgi:hypothetical protein